MDNNLIILEDVSKLYGKFKALDNISLQVATGQVCAFLGPNGAGKTTTIRIMMGILQPTSGKIYIDGLDCFTDRVAVKRAVGYLPDAPVFYDYLTGMEIIYFTGEMHGLSKPEIKAKSQPFIEQFKIGEALSDYAVNYSRGMKKKLGLICALLHDPKLLILDEPTSGLDPGSVKILHQLLKTRVQCGKSVFFSTHLLDQVEKLADTVAILYQGKLVAADTLPNLRDKFDQASLEDIFFTVTGNNHLQFEGNQQ